MSAAHERAARRLAGLLPREREWVLARLADADRRRIVELLAERDAGLPVEAAQELPQAEADSPEAAVARAATASIARALDEEPDWLVALLLAARRWPWDREYLAGLPAGRVATLRALALDGAFQPRACREAIAALAARLASERPAAAPRTAFDDVLADALRQPSTQERTTWQ